MVNAVSAAVGKQLRSGTAGHVMDFSIYIPHMRAALVRILPGNAGRIPRGVAEGQCSEGHILPTLLRITSNPHLQPVELDEPHLHLLEAVIHTFGIFSPSSYAFFAAQPLQFFARRI